MSREQQGQTFDTAKGQNAGYYANSQNSYANAQTDVGDFQKQLADYAAKNPYKQGGEFQTRENQVLANTSDAAARSAGNVLQSQALRTGQNSAGAIAATEAMQQQNTRDLSAEQAAEEGKRIGAQADYNKGALEASAEPARMEMQLAGQQAQAGEGALNTQEQAAKTPSWIEDFSQGIMNAGTAFAGGAGAAMCPAQGSLYLMDDGTETPVEVLIIGNLLRGIDGEPQVIEEIQFSYSPVLQIRTDDGFVTRNSRVHAFALPHGGFVVAAHSLGKSIRTANGCGKVIDIEPDGMDWVFNVITNGSHTYRADGVWALGVGEAERQISMATWDQIGDRLEKEAIGMGA